MYKKTKPAQTKLANKVNLIWEGFSNERKTEQTKQTAKCATEQTKQATKQCARKQSEER